MKLIIVMPTIARVVYAALAFTATITTAAQADWLESNNGDLSNDGNAPTPIAFSIGINVIEGTMGAKQQGFDPDIFTFTIGPGELLTSLRLVVFEPAENSFFAIASGPTIRTNITHPNENGSSHMSNLLIRGSTGELLPVLAASKEFGGSTSTVTDPLGPGTYSVWFQEVAATVAYRYEYTVVPEPSSAMLVLVGAAALLRRRR